MNTDTIRSLVTAAINASENAYAPYSGFPVGAAVLTAGGQIFTGCNIENAAFGAGICAERTAASKAISQGEKELIAVAVAAGDTPTPPCGICRQFLAEFGNPDIIMASLDGEFHIKPLSELLPEAFNSFKPQM